MKQQAYHHDDRSEGKFSRAGEVRVVSCWTGASHHSKGELLRDSEVFVSDENPQDQTDYKCGGAAVCVCLGEVEDQQELGEQ